MKIKTNLGELSSAVATAMLAVQSKSSNQAYEHLLIETVRGDMPMEDSIRITGTSGEMTISIDQPAEIEEEGKLLLPGKPLNAIISRMPTGKAMVSTQGSSYAVIIQCGQSNTSLMGIEPGLFPQPKVADKKHTVKIPREALLDMIAATESSIGVDESRPVLAGACLEVTHTDITMIGLDGYRMAVRRIPNGNSDSSEFSAIIPRRSIGTVRKLLTKADVETVDLDFGTNTLSMQIGWLSLQCTLIDGDYIQWKQIAPKSFSTHIVADAEVMRKAIDRARVVAASATVNKLATLRIAGDEMTISAASSTGTYDEIVELDQHDGADLTIAFNVNYIIDAFNLISCEKVTLDFNSPVAPCVIKQANDNDTFWLILPVRTGVQS